MSRLSPTQSSRRLTLLYVLLLAVALIILARLFYWQVVRHDDLSSKAYVQRERTITEYARRGDILTSDGALLATDVYVYEIAAHPPVISDAQRTAALLAPVLNAGEAELARLLQQKDQSTVMVDRNAPSNAGSKLLELRAAGKLAGVDFIAKPYRRYPGGSLAAHLVGFVNAGRKGAYGVEQYYDELLAGRDGEIRAETHALGDDVL